ncbi:hypothetical protein C8J56DRAFT_1045627 [Mycena floridula]|nr:hypothetical protein C8J56DRAFT_1045627 [Mycena floridula]
MRIVFPGGSRVHIATLLKVLAAYANNPRNHFPSQLRSILQHTGFYRDIDVSTICIPKYDMEGINDSMSGYRALGPLSQISFENYCFPGDIPNLASDIFSMAEPHLHPSIQPFMEMYCGYSNYFQQHSHFFLLFTIPVTTLIQSHSGTLVQSFQQSYSPSVHPIQVTEPSSSSSSVASLMDLLVRAQAQSSPTSVSVSTPRTTIMTNPTPPSSPPSNFIITTISDLCSVLNLDIALCSRAKYTSSRCIAAMFESVEAMYLILEKIGFSSSLGMIGKVEVILAFNQFNISSHEVLKHFGWKSPKTYQNKVESLIWASQSRKSGLRWASQIPGMSFISPKITLTHSQ